MEVSGGLLDMKGFLGQNSNDEARIGFVIVSTAVVDIDIRVLWYSRV